MVLPVSEASNSSDRSEMSALQKPTGGGRSRPHFGFARAYLPVPAATSARFTPELRLDRSTILDATQHVGATRLAPRQVVLPRSPAPFVARARRLSTSRLQPLNR